MCNIEFTNFDEMSTDPIIGAIFTQRETDYLVYCAPFDELSR